MAEKIDRNKEKLKAVIKDEITKLFEQALDYAQEACASPETYKVLRGKILRVGNNCIRTLNGKLSNYGVEYIAPAEDIIEVKQCVKGGKDNER